MTRHTPILIMMFAALSLAACVQGKNYERPAVDVPADWSTVAAADPARFPADQQPDAEWWRAFGNDELTGLIERALQQNHDVKRAVARVLESRAAVMSAAAGLYPQVNLQGSYSSLAVSKNTLAGLGLARGGQPGPQVFATPGSTFNLWNGSVDLRWELDFWGRIRRLTEAARAEYLSTDEARRGVTVKIGRAHV